MKIFFYVFFFLGLTGCSSQPPAPVVQRSYKDSAGSSSFFANNQSGRSWEDSRNILRKELHQKPIDKKIKNVQIAPISSQPVPIPEEQVELKILSRNNQPNAQKKSFETNPTEERLIKPPANSRKSSSEQHFSSKSENKQLSSEQDSFIWPAIGQIVEGGIDSSTSGLTVIGRAGTPVVSVGNGKVIFSGQGPEGYGKLLIIRHDKDLLSVYGRNRNLLVKEGNEVKRGQRIAEMGAAETGVAGLYFEIRKQGRPVDPKNFLPPF